MISNVKKLHYFSGITLSLFIGFHMVNQLFSLGGPEAHISLMENFRKVYRHPDVESILLAAVAFQLVTGIRLVFNRKKKILAEKVQIFSGLYLSFFLIVHVGAVLYGRYHEIDTNFYYAAGGLNAYPAMLFFIPYYTLAVIAVSLHVATLHYLKTGMRKSAFAIAGVGIVVSLFILMGFTDWLQWRVM